jgi:hypothetical protein
MRAMDARFIFTVSTGRCGEASFAELVRRHVANAYAAFEEPRVRPILPGVLGDLERHFRRRFVETDELLGRGHVLRAFVAGDDAFIDAIVSRRLASIRKRLAREGKQIYVDVSKFFARGLHAGFARALPKFGLVLLVRDPIINMRSYLNRNKNFLKDNVRPDAGRNLLRLDFPSLSGGELYLWAWCEMYLRFLALCESDQVTHSAVIRTEDLGRTECMTAHFRALALEHAPISIIPAMNTNVERGYGPTVVTTADIRTYERFLKRLPAGVIGKIDYFNAYCPRESP